MVLCLVGILVIEDYALELFASRSFVSVIPLCGLFSESSNVPARIFQQAATAEENGTTQSVLIGRRLMEACGQFIRALPCKQLMSSGHCLQLKGEDFQIHWLNKGMVGTEKCFHFEANFAKKKKKTLGIPFNFAQSLLDLRLNFDTTLLEP